MYQVFFPTIFPRVRGVHYFGEGFISNLPVSNIIPPFRASVMAVGERVYADDTKLIKECHFDFKRVALIRTLSSHNTSTAKREISFRANEPTRVWVAYDEKGSSGLPSWLKQKFRRTGHKIITSQNEEYQLYMLETRAGEISLGGNARGVQRPGKNYFVIIENLKNENVVVTRDVIDITVDEIKYTSDNLIQMYSNGMLVHNIFVDPKHCLYIHQDQFIQNGLSILNVSLIGSAILAPEVKNILYKEITGGPTLTGNNVVFRYPELVDGEIIIRERIDPEIIPAEITDFFVDQTVNEIEYKIFEELVVDLNLSSIPFEPFIEDFICQPYQPPEGQSFLSFEEQEPLVNPHILIYGTNFIEPNHEASIFWKSFNGSRILFNKKEIDFKGILKVNPSSTTSYSFTVEADDEIISTNYIIQVKTDAYPDTVNLPKLSLYSDKKKVNKGDVITLSWVAENVTGLFLGEHEITDFSSNKTIEINENTEFILKGSNGVFEAETRLLIRINLPVEAC